LISASARMLRQEFPVQSTNTFFGLN